jgi:hypothetical protein
MRPLRHAFMLLLVIGVVGCSQNAPSTSPSPSPSASPAEVSPTPVSRPTTSPSASVSTLDAIRIETVNSLAMSLERYHNTVGTYPTTLDALFPDYAPPDVNASDLDVYNYTSTGTEYILSTELSDGTPYVVTSPKS